MKRKIATLRNEIAKANLKKSGKNQFQKFDYYELGDFLPKTIELELEIGLLSVFNLDEFNATLTIYDLDKDDKITFTTNTRDANVEKMIEIQKLGSIHTYLKRYLYLNYLNLTEPDTIDGRNQDDKKATPKVIKTAAEVVKKVEEVKTENHYLQRQMLIDDINALGTPEQLKAISDKYSNFNEIPFPTLEKMAAKLREENGVSK